MNIRIVDGADQKNASALTWLQLEILPNDVPCDPTAGHWWIAYEGPSPVAFAAIVQSVRWSDTGYLNRAGVLASHRGKGLQKRLIRVRERKARDMGWNWLVTDTRDNPASANSLIACGFRMFRPSQPWGHTDAVYWRKALK